MTIPFEEYSVSTAALSGMSSDQIEQMLEQSAGKTEIIGDEILHHHMPGCEEKSAVGLHITGHYNSFQNFHNMKGTSGTGGTKFLNDSVLVPDFSVWKEENLCDSYTNRHLYTYSTAPNFVLEFEWYHERNQEKKGTDKILHQYFHPFFIGAQNQRGQNTVVEEAWLLSVHQDFVFNPRHITTPVRLRWIPVFGFILQCICGLIRGIPRSLEQDAVYSQSTIYYYIWYISAIVARFVCFLCYKTCPVKQHPPVDARTPYLTIYFRDNADHPLYYHLEEDSIFIPPAQSIFALASPLNVNGILNKCY